jgi:hypothetical protein
MTHVLHLPARPGAPVACDMSTAADTPEERLAEYASLFSRALERRSRAGRAVVFTLRADAGVRDSVEDLARRESLCCPFLALDVESGERFVTFTITSPALSADAVLDAFYALADPATAAA